MSSRFLCILLASCLVALPYLATADRPLLIDRQQVPVCYNYGCKIKTRIRIDNAAWRQITTLFQLPAASAAEERSRIRLAIALFERITGRQTPTYRDKARNAVDAEWPGQMDCIDESTNTTTYLRLLAQAGLLKWHRVGERIYRRSFIGHWSAQIIDRQSGQHYVVDSWFRDNGQLPYIQKSEDWKRWRRFPPQPVAYTSLSR